MSTPSDTMRTATSQGRSDAAMIAIENSVEGGVSATQDALATVPGLRIVGEYVVPVNFVLVARPGTLAAAAAAGAAAAACVALVRRVRLARSLSEAGSGSLDLGLVER